MICQKAHRYDPILEQLPEDQGGPGRHKCAGCAYERGFEDGRNGLQPRFEAIVKNLDDSQAGTGRHRDPRQAYMRGYQDGANRNN